MTIVHLVAGAGDMYCGSCMHGNGLVNALQKAGQDVLLAPVYTPLRTDEQDASVDHVAFGGVSVYLQQATALFRHTPWFVDWLLDRPGFLRWIGHRSESTRPEHLGPLTVSMLRGEDGRQGKELRKLIRWLQQELQPRVIHLSNVMLCGMARQLSKQFQIPIVCTLSGEDLFLEQLPEPHYSAARAALCERSADLAGLVAMNHYYADFMADYLSVPRERIQVIPPGLNLSGHAATPHREPVDPASPRSINIGYLSRICPEKGLHQLAEAFRLLNDDATLPPLRLLAAGYLGEGDQAYLKEIQNQFDKQGLSDRFQYVGSLDRNQKIDFLQSLDLISVPTVYHESKGLPILEAWANGVPAVLPAHGTFPELVNDTGGGLLYDSDSLSALAAALKRMVLDPQLRTAMGDKAHQAVHQRYHAELMAERTIAFYQHTLTMHSNQ